ncbi:MarR family transcriptional regulator [Chromobacterium subtsugae]|uniref:MarR family transcriptional regulator n=1 Tax=Chromobacterium subtsugae TaxID=251747 RepID=A0ABS7FHS6_9NEIS|nr:MULTISPECIES: MarR family transcriptional regulator [Chromobacterium]KUM03271.1 hypothetical protein Cv017_20535 [Chromobacterium subtsugae]KZE85278.1 hypothetical protein AWB61_02540 [Chromobacterium sp. F49]MBW7568465.1 MarR family transcriptional regulator [Chromobacterium subtsugae]MBW8289640.1 MarR family transcriptional regulator [Chromobacterium subtsugae]OBU84987.1 hypothetical protein MY55_19295 [Chromobacterium subtsugae]
MEHAATSPLFTPYSAETYRIDTSLGQQIASLHHQLLRQIDQRMEPLELTAAQWKVLMRVLSGEVRSASDLCRQLECDTGSMTRMLDRLEEKGFIHRLRSKDDRRVVLVKPTSICRQLRPELVDAAVEVLNRALVNFHPDDFAALRRLLAQLSANLNP